MPRIDLIKLRRGTATEWESVNPTLADGEYGYEKDTKKSKIGDGSTAWNDLDYLDVPTASSLPPIENVYADIAEMLANQGSQTTGFLQEVTDASADPNIVSGTWFYKKKASSTGTLATDYTPLTQGEITALLDSQGKQTADCGTVIPLDTVYGHNCNMQSANANTAYTINNENLINAYARVLINATSEPTVSGATQRGGVSFVADTNMILLVENLGDAGIVYSFNPVSVNTGEADTLQTVTTRGATTTTKSIFQGNAQVGDVSEGELDFGTNGSQITVDGGEMLLRHENNNYALDKAGMSVEIVSISGNWNASTNTPTLANTDTGVKAVEYKVSVAGTQDFGAGNITFAVGDIVANDGTIWYKKVDNNQLGSLKEQNIIGNRVDATVSGTYDIDLNNGSVFRLTMTADTTFSISNLPTGTDVKAFTVILTGDFVPTLPAYCELTPSSDTYDGTVRNRLIFDVIEGTTSSEDVIVTQENLAS